jgi:Zn-finger domain-containing protein
MNIESTICEICKRPILKHEVDDGIAYCYGCNHYFPAKRIVSRKRNEIVIPGGSDFIRYRIEQDALEVSFRWFKNYHITRFDIDNQNETGSLYGLLAYLFNRTTIKVTSQFIMIQHKPFEILPLVYYRSDLITQLYVKETDITKKLSGEIKEYGLYARFRNETEDIWLWGLKKRVLLFIEQEIERVLKISDEKIFGEETH